MGLLGLGQVAAAKQDDPQVVERAATPEGLARIGQIVQEQAAERVVVGLPLTLLRLEPEHRAAVLAMGMYVGGVIATLAALGRPSIGIVTAVAPVHLERAGSLAAIEDAKAELVEALPDAGTAILNQDDVRVRAFRSRTRAAVLTYGLDPGADVTAEAVTSRGVHGMTFDFVACAPRPARFQVEIGALGRHSVQNALAAAAAGLVAGLTDEQIAAGLATPWGRASAHRGVVVEAPGLTILDDTYNASPPAMLAVDACPAATPPTSSGACTVDISVTRATTSGCIRPVKIRSDFGRLTTRATKSKMKVPPRIDGAC
jgi:UDP-N-acetylmuramyl pentapeptide synthase